MDEIGSVTSHSPNGSVAEHSDLYDLLFENHSSDIAMYQSIMSGHEEVLEYGVGTGRIAIPLALSGVRVLGVDNSASMLSRLRAVREEVPELLSRIEIVEGDMVVFRPQREFDRIICPFMTINYLIDGESRVAFLRRVRGALSSQGEFWFEAISSRTLPEIFTNDGVLRKVWFRNRPDGSREVDLYRNVRFERESRVVEQDRYYKFYDTKGIQTREIVVTWRNVLLSLGDIETDLGNAGMRLSGSYGDHEFGPLTAESEFLVVCASWA